MLRKENLKSGAILPIFTNYQVQEGFRGMAQLISCSDKSVIMGTGTSHYISIKESSSPDTMFYIGQEVKYNGERQWRILEIYRDGILIRKGDEKVAVDSPYKDITVYFTSGNSLFLEEDEYVKHWKVIDDDSKQTTVVTYAKFMEPDREETPLVLKKPFRYRYEKKENRTAIYDTERWLVEFLINPFYGRLKVGQEVYYLHHGKAKIKSLNFGKITIESKYDRNKEIEVSTNEIYIEELSGIKTFAKISFFLSTAATFPSNTVLKDIEEEESDTEEDLWNNVDIDFNEEI